mmetsp:Transcript_19160/g.49108  ORF Transcript_19160/g.49108 Transcript_19160/m.49108 type:complete len:250 (-) Transcript_19160:2786-3535(-)
MPITFGAAASLTLSLSSPFFFCSRIATPSSNAATSSERASTPALKPRWRAPLKAPAETPPAVLDTPFFSPPLPCLFFSVAAGAGGARRSTSSLSSSSSSRRKRGSSLPSLMSCPTARKASNTASSPVPSRYSVASVLCRSPTSSSAARISRVLLSSSASILFAFFTSFPSSPASFSALDASALSLSSCVSSCIHAALSSSTDTLSSAAIDSIPVTAADTCTLSSSVVGRDSSIFTRCLTSNGSTSVNSA